MQSQDLESLKKLSEDIKHYDPHIRQNAVISYSKYFLIDSERNKLKDEEKALIVNALLNTLDVSEDSTEVKSRSFKVFTQIACFLKEKEIEQVFSRCIGYIISDKTEGRDIYVNCIKGILDVVPTSFYEMIGKVILPILAKGLESTNLDIIRQSLDTLNDYICTFDVMLVNPEKAKKLNMDINKYAKIALKNITSSLDGLKVISIKFLGAMGVLMDKKDITSVIKEIISIFNKSQELKDKISCFQALRNIAKTAGLKQVGLIKGILPILLKYCEKAFITDEALNYDERNELSESALNCLDIYINTSLQTVKDDIPNIAKRCLELITHDPNYFYQENQAQSMNVEEDDPYGNYEDDYFDADEDSSWKIRKASAQIISSILKSGYQLNEDTKELVLKILSNCFREHDDNTKIEIISATISFYANLVVIKNDDLMSGLALVKRKSSIQNFIPVLSKKILDSIKLDLGGNNGLIKVKELNLLPYIAMVSSEEVVEELPNLLPCLEASCLSSNDTKILLMQFLSKLFNADKFNDDYKAVNVYDKLTSFIKDSIVNKNFRVSTYGIICASYLFPILGQESNENNKYIMALYDAIYPKFQQNDTDPEIKISTVNSIAEFITNCGDILPPKTLETLVNIYLDKAQNDLMKQNVLNALIKIVKGNEEKQIDLSKVISKTKKIIVDILTSAPTLTQTKALTLLSKIYEKYPSSFEEHQAELTKLMINMNNQEGLIAYIFDVFTQMLSVIKKNIIIQIFEYIETKLPDINLGKDDLMPVYDFVRNATKKLNKDDIKPLINNYLNKIKTYNETQSYFISILICFAEQEDAFIDTILKIICNPKQEKEMRNCLFLMGNICENSNKQHDDLINKLESIQANSNESIKEVIAISIGQIGINNPMKFISEIQKGAQDNYKLISIKAFLTLLIKNNKKLDDNIILDLVQWLLKKNNLNEDKVNKLVGTCIGISISVHIKLLDEYLKLLDNCNENSQKSSLIYGLKYLIAKITDLKTGEVIQRILNNINDEELLIREHSMTSLSEACKTFKTVIPELINKNNLFDIIIKNGKINKKYIKEIDFGGNNKIIEDYGVIIRKESFSILKIIIDEYPTKINYENILNLLVEGILDTDDNVRNEIYDDLTKLASFNTAAFNPVAPKMFDNLIKAYRLLRTEKSKQSYFAKVKELFDELSEEKTITENTQYNLILKTVNDNLKKEN